MSLTCWLQLCFKSNLLKWNPRVPVTLNETVTGARWYYLHRHVLVIWKWQSCAHSQAILHVPWSGMAFTGPWNPWQIYFWTFFFHSFHLLSIAVSLMAGRWRIFEKYLNPYPKTELVPWSGPYVMFQNSVAEPPWGMPVAMESFAYIER